MSPGRPASLSGSITPEYNPDRAKTKYYGTTGSRNSFRRVETATATAPLRGNVEPCEGHVTIG